MHNATKTELNNARQLYADVFWYGLLAGSTLAFLSVYAAHLHATSFQIGLLTAGPAVVNLLFSLPAGHWLEKQPTARAVFITSIWNRLGYVVLIPLPILLPAAAQVWALPLIVLLMSIPGTILAIAFNALFADAVPPERRAHVVGRRNALLAMSSTLSSLACGWLLDRIAFPLNYQIVFTLGVVGAGLSSFYRGRIRLTTPPPARVNRAIDDDARPGQFRFADAPRPAIGLRFLTRGAGQKLLRWDLLRGSFGPFLAAYFCFYTTQYLTIPLIPLMWVHELHLSDGTISLTSAIFWVVMLFASMGLARLTLQVGNQRLLTWGAVLYGFYPLWHGLARDATLVWVASVMGGAVWALTNGGLVNRLMERVPNDDRPAHMALHNLALNLGILAGSFLGPALAESIGLREALIAGALLRAFSGLLLGLWG